MVTGESYVPVGTELQQNTVGAGDAVAALRTAAGVQGGAERGQRHALLADGVVVGWCCGAEVGAGWVAGKCCRRQHWRFCLVSGRI